MILLTILICSASTAFSYQMENFEAGKCKVGSNDLVLWGISYLKCLHECRARAACTSINVNQKVGECRLNFDDANIQNKSCGLYVYSEKSNWKQKTLCGRPTCEKESNEKTNPDCTCTVEECKKMQRPDDCFLMGNGRLIGHKVVYVYRDAQNVSTSLRYKCLDNGTWSGKPLEDCTDCSMPANTGLRKYRNTYQIYKNKTITDPGKLIEKERMLFPWNSVLPALSVLNISGCTGDPNCRAIGAVSEGGKINITTYHGHGPFQIGEPTGNFESAILFVRCA